MHELSLLNDLFRKIDDVVVAQRAERATRVIIQLGPLAHISPTHLKEHFDQAKPSTSAARAELEVVTIDAEHPQAQDLVLKSVEVA